MKENEGSHGSGPNLRWADDATSAREREERASGIDQELVVSVRVWPFSSDGELRDAAIARLRRDERARAQKARRDALLEEAIVFRTALMDRQIWDGDLSAALDTLETILVDREAQVRVKVGIVVVLRRSSVRTVAIGDVPDDTLAEHYARKADLLRGLIARQRGPSAQAADRWRAELVRARTWRDARDLERGAASAEEYQAAVVAAVDEVAREVAAAERAPAVERLYRTLVEVAKAVPANLAAGAILDLAFRLYDAQTEGTPIAPAAAPATQTPAAPPRRMQARHFGPEVELPPLDSLRSRLASNVMPAAPGALWRPPTGGIWIYRGFAFEILPDPDVMIGEGPTTAFIGGMPILLVVDVSYRSARFELIATGGCYGQPTWGSGKDQLIDRLADELASALVPRGRPPIPAFHVGELDNTGRMVRSYDVRWERIRGRRARRVLQTWPP
jgi:hypothetical protein